MIHRNDSGKADTSGREAARRAIFDVERLRRDAGEKVFARGVDYHAEGLVEIFSLGEARVRARVIGTEPYLVDLAVDGDKLIGDCTCPAHRDFGFCKHMVASGLAANEARLQGEQASGDGLDPIKAHLNSLNAGALKELILGFAERDPDILRRLALRASLSSGDVGAVTKRLRREIDAATKISGYIDYGKAEAWAARAGEVIDSIGGFLAEGAAKPVIELVDRLMNRLEQAMERIDDSDGWVGGLLTRAAELHLSACRMSGPDPVLLARELYSRELDGDFGFENAIEAYSDVLGEAGQIEMGRLAAEAWAKIPPLRRRKGAVDDDGWFVRSRLAAILDFLAEKQKDLDARIAIRCKDLSQPADFLALAQFCDEHGRSPDAVKWVEEALFVFEDELDERLAIFAAELFSRHKRMADAGGLLWRTFERRPSEALHRQIVARLKGNERIAATDRAVAILKKATTSPKTAGQGRREGESDLILSLLVVEKRYADAWEIARSMGGSGHRLEQLANASEASHPREASNIYRLRVESVLGAGGSHNYHEAKSLIERMRVIAHQSGSAQAQASFEKDLLARHRAKRNFIKLMGATSGKDGLAR